MGQQLGVTAMVSGLEEVNYIVLGVTGASAACVQQFRGMFVDRIVLISHTVFVTIV